MVGFALPDVKADISEDTLAEINSIFENMYKVIVHDDDITTFETVITALVRLFELSPKRAEELAMQVHNEGQAIVAVLPKEEAEEGVKGLHKFKINASSEAA